MSTIVLSCGSFSLTLSKFTNLSYPRERINPPTLSFSAYGSPIREGSFFEAKHAWNLEFLLTETEQLTLDRMYSLWLLSSPVPTVTLTDKTQRISEPSPRTRALASGTTESTASGMTSYYAVFNTEFTSEPKYSENGKDVRVSLQLTETTKTTP